MKKIFFLFIFILILFGFYSYIFYIPNNNGTTDQHIITSLEDSNKIPYSQPTQEIKAKERKITQKGKIIPFQKPPAFTHPKVKSLPKTKHKTKQNRKYKCDGRKYCSQMRSYEEAKFFLRHCPGVKMDGDDDGIPCERQFRRYD